jgi:hypothetical protein
VLRSFAVAEVHGVSKPDSDTGFSSCVALGLGISALLWQFACCALQWCWRGSPVADLYCTKNFLSGSWPRWLLYGSELWTALVAGLCAVGWLARRSAEPLWRTTLRVNAAGLAVLCVLTWWKIGHEEIAALCNLDKRSSFGGIPWVDLRDAVWTRVWVGVLPLGGVTWMAMMAAMSLAASRPFARSGE